MIFYSMMLLVQDNFEDRPTTNPESGTAFDGYIDFFADLMFIGAAFLALFSAYRIYQNTMLSSEHFTNDISHRITNLVLGMIFCLLIGSWIKLTF